MKTLLGITVSLLWALVLLEASLLQQAPPDCSTITPEECEAQAKVFVEVTYEAEISRMCQQAVLADWEYNTDLGDPDKEQAATEANIAYSKSIFDHWDNVLRHYNYTDFIEESLKRQLKFLNIVGTAALNDADLTQYNTILATMSRVYGTGKICPFAKQDCDLATEGLNLEPEIEAILSTSRDPAELAYVWEAWRDVSGRQIRETYKDYIALSNKAAEANGLPNNGDLWLARYESPDFRTQVAEVWDTVKGLYAELYGYVRFKLRETYPGEFADSTDPIPAHILGNMWAQSWESLYPLMIPHPDEPGFDVTEALKNKFNSTEEGVRALFEEANFFFTDLGLEDMSMSYGEDAVIVRPEDRDVVCHASAWDFCDRQDFRIKMCTNVNQEDYATVHHELGHIQYFLMYKDKPITFRDGSNPGFHEAIGDVIALSVATPKHMAKLGYLDSGELNDTVTENFLMQKALEKIAFLPFGYLIDAYRWKLFDGSASLDRMEYEWLKIRNEIQGVRPPVRRSEGDFDAGAKYHVPGNTPYIRYFVSFIIQFQIHKALCIAANEYDPEDLEKPLYNCDIGGNPTAGNIMKTLLQKGFSENWQDVLEAAIGTREMDGSAIVEYFSPLTSYLQRQRAQHGYVLEWKVDAFEDYYTAPTEGTTTGNPSDPTTTTGNPSDPTTTTGNPSDPTTTTGNPSDPTTTTGNPSDPTTTTGNPSDPTTTTGSSTTSGGPRDNKLSTGLIIIGIIQGCTIVLVHMLWKPSY
ncbi:angiotensin-converting enzyme [Folsomia candida]|uniref:Angiotensin-converting enzyme n=1 Tax=Folsomia candida TaxID=158441 RepID=A0A226DF03_FOLCA|nr:angiotensin-converting enzyme [Folsomia candida]OXA43749.1 Angiotensin-converting enzyme [Folsomia candida]